MNDLIKRLFEIRGIYNCLDEFDEPYYRALSEAIQFINTHTEKRTEEHTKTHAYDLISRQAAIDALSNMMDIDGFRDGYAVSRANVNSMLKWLPPAQPEVDCRKCGAEMRGGEDGKA